MTGHSYTGYHKPYFIVTWVEFSVSVLLLAARCYASLRIVKSSAPDLYLAILTFTFGAASMVVLTIAAEAGLGVRGIVLNDSDQINALLYGWLNQFLALVAIGLGKVTIVAFLQQIQGYHTVFRTVLLWLLAGSNLIVNCIAAALLITQCDPVQKLWDDSIPGSCAGRKRIQVFGYVQGTWSAFCDFALALFPVFLFAGIRAISVPTRIGLSILMGSGIVAGACTIVKTIKLSRLTTFTDATHQLQYVIVWNQSEMWVVFIVSCLPPAKVFFTRIFKQTTSLLRRQSG
ncbi:hypothetical protein ASPSYDRAFT_39267 [Aspergillus sydowii CBS 593.65]|uniref:Rhodopsin domain-containing protein n=1 Tax=Aspergillus sydowii CBS 593.65 TaxID=1036612 RepID=A0A1L9TYP6_9EURO|nr:uncharacterized protein ASPSYDRAFT_39267 [Aspergillus sydowii CBS 593.65]OJJ64539.1 hypothetical protein ASPSYDRAFT_39267 [Aspergillus sydowii CBS 593.65]